MVEFSAQFSRRVVGGAMWVWLLSLKQFSKLEPMFYGQLQSTSRTASVFQLFAHTGVIDSMKYIFVMYVRCLVTSNKSVACTDRTA